MPSESDSYVINRRPHKWRLEMKARCYAPQEPASAGEADSSKLTTMLLAMADVRAVLVNLAARLHQLRGLAAGGGGNGTALAEEMLRVFAPLANRLGVWSLKAEMEDLCFQVCHKPSFYVRLNPAASLPPSCQGRCALQSGPPFLGRGACSRPEQ